MFLQLDIIIFVIFLCNRVVVHFEELVVWACFVLHLAKSCDPNVSELGWIDIHIGAQDFHIICTQLIELLIVGTREFQLLIIFQ